MSDWVKFGNSVRLSLGPVGGIAVIEVVLPNKKQYWKITVLGEEVAGLYNNVPAGKADAMALAEEHLSAALKILYKNGGIPRTGPINPPKVFLVAGSPVQAVKAGHGGALIWTDLADRQLIEMYTALDMSSNKIARAFGVSPSTVDGRREKLGLKLKSPKPGPSS